MDMNPVLTHSPPGRSLRSQRSTLWLKGLTWLLDTRAWEQKDVIWRWFSLCTKLRQSQLQCTADRLNSLVFKRWLAKLERVQKEALKWFKTGKKCFMTLKDQTTSCCFSCQKADWEMIWLQRIIIFMGRKYCLSLIWQGKVERELITGSWKQLKWGIKCEHWWWSTGTTIFQRMCSGRTKLSKAPKPRASASGQPQVRGLGTHVLARGTQVPNLVARSCRKM